MKIIVRPPKTGKTQELIEESAKNGGVIICCDRGRVKSIQRLALDKGLNIPTPITFAAFIGGHTIGSCINEVYIDSIEECLQSLISIPIKIMTVQTKK